MASHNPKFITGSTCSVLMTGKGTDLLVGATTFARQIARERLEACESESTFTGNYATEWGNEHELEATEHYESAYFATVEDRQKVFQKGYLSCTVDGRANDILIEVKCPFSSDVHHLNVVDKESFKLKHYDQCQFNMILTGLKTTHLISYDPRFVDSLKMSVIAFHADHHWIDKFEDRYTKFELIVDEEITKLTNIQK